MTYEQNRELIEIVKHYGIGSQSKKAIEECAELIQALTKNDVTREEVIDEIADVSVMLAQLMIIFDCTGEVEERIDFKINRQKERMKEGK